MNAPSLLPKEAENLEPCHATREAIQSIEPNRALGTLQAAREALFALWGSKDTPPAIVIKAIDADAKLAGWHKPKLEIEGDVEIVVKIGGGGPNAAALSSLG